MTDENLHVLALPPFRVLVRLLWVYGCSQLRIEGKCDLDALTRRDAGDAIDIEPIGQCRRVIETRVGLSLSDLAGVLDPLVHLVQADLELRENPLSLAIIVNLDRLAGDLRPSGARLSFRRPTGGEDRQDRTRRQAHR